MKPEIQQGLLNFMKEADTYPDCVVALEAAMAYLDMWPHDVTVRSACEALMMKIDMFQSVKA